MPDTGRHTAKRTSTRCYTSPEEGPLGKARTRPDVKQLLVLSKDPDALSAGKSVFVSKCAACHVSDGGGLVGPNLADTSWIHGKGKLSDIYGVVRDGVPDKGMPAWGALLTDPELNQVVAYVKKFQGTQPANAKAAQGVEVSAEESTD